MTVTFTRVVPVLTAVIKASVLVVVVDSPERVIRVPLQIAQDAEATVEDVAVVWDVRSHIVLHASPTFMVSVLKLIT